MLPLAAAIVLLAGCGGGGGPHMARTDAAPLIALAHRIADEQPCAQARDIRALQAKANLLVNERRVPASLQESLMSGVNALHEQAPVCLPAVHASTPEIPSPSARPGPAGKHHHDHDHGDAHGHGKGGKH